MSKELEYAIKNVETYLRANHCNLDSFNTIKKALTPPTADEVCDLLSKQLKSTIVTKKNKHGITFNYAETGKTIISRNYENIDIRVQLTPKSFEIIGKFYGGAVK